MSLPPLISHVPLPNNKQLGNYLAGLIEGDGTIIVPKTIRNQQGKIKKKTKKKDMW